MTTQVTILKTEIIEPYKIIQVEQQTDYIDGENIVVSKRNHQTYAPAMSLDKVPSELHGLANLLWTQEVKDAWDAAHPVEAPSEEQTA